MYGMFFMYFSIDFPTLKPNKPKKPKKKFKNLGFYQPCLYRILISGGLTANMSIHELYNEHSVCTDTRN